MDKDFIPFPKGAWHDAGYTIYFLEPDNPHSPLTHVIRALPTHNMGSLNLNSGHAKQRMVMESNPKPLTRVCKELPAPVRMRTRKEIERELIDAYLFDRDKQDFKRKRAARLAATPV